MKTVTLKAMRLAIIPSWDIGWDWEFSYYYFTAGKWWTISDTPLFETIGRACPRPWQFLLQYCLETGNPMMVKEICFGPATMSWLSIWVKEMLGDWQGGNWLGGQNAWMTRHDGYPFFCFLLATHFFICYNFLYSARKVRQGLGIGGIWSGYHGGALKHWDIEAFFFFFFFFFLLLFPPSFFPPSFSSSLFFSLFFFFCRHLV